MVRFLSSTHPDDDPITVWCEPLDNGFRLVHREANGHLHAERFDDRTSLFDATVRLQAELTRAGWHPQPDDGARRHAARARQFHR